MSEIPEKYKNLYAELFVGRQDVYAIRWENNGNSGYRPAYTIDWQSYNKHKAQGGTFKNFKEKKYALLTSAILEKHWRGEELIGIYPLLPDNTSHFIVADFDKADWRDQVLKFSNFCNQFNLHHTIEKSRSGNGAHCWFFFTNQYPAQKSRKIIYELLRRADIISDFEKNGSFDRLFPNQDFHKGIGLGNLIALPLNGRCLVDGNTSFLQLESLNVITKQWEYLNTIKKNSPQKLDEIFVELFEVSQDSNRHSLSLSKEIRIILNNQLWLKKEHLTLKVKVFIREKLNFLNADYFIKKNMGRSTFKTELFFKLINETEDEIILPKGFTEDLVQFLKDENLPFVIDDYRKKHDPISFNSNINLYPYQRKVLEVALKNNSGVIVAPPGTGKTIISLALISELKQPALIIVHRKQLFDQWIDRIQTFLKIPSHEIGCIDSVKKKIGNRVTVAMIQSLKKISSSKDYNQAFGTIIVDECHHIPAKTFRETITNFNSYFLYGITATPKRKNNDENLIFTYIGKILAEVDTNEVSHLSSKVELIVRKTNLKVPFNYQTDVYELLSNVLVFDSSRNRLISGDTEQLIAKGKRILILSERRSHLEVLNLYIKDRFETIVLSGEDSKRDRKAKLEQIRMGHFQVLLSTGQFLGEGIDIPNFNCLMLVYPFAFEGKIIQYIGRVQRSEKTPLIIDYRDNKVEYFEKQFKKRNSYYNKLRRKEMLVDLN